MQIRKDILEALADRKVVADFEFVAEELFGTTRWGNLYRLIVRDTVNDVLYEHIYEVGSGDSDYSSWDDYGDYVDANEVVAVEKTVVEYVVKQ